MEERVWRAAPLGAIPARRTFVVAPDRLDPVIHVAHRVPWPIDLPDRILFDHELVLIQDGRGELSGAAGTVPLAPHRLLFVPPFEPHGIRSTGGGRHEHIAVHFDLAPGVPAAGGS